MADLRTNIAALLLADFTGEAEAGFPIVRRIPSTDAVKFLDYFATLNSAEAAALLDALARGHAMQFFPRSAVHREGLELSESNSALVRFRDATRTGQFAYGLRYQDVRHVRTALRDPVSMRYMADTRSKLDFVPRDDPPSELMPEPDRLKVQTANAPLLRKLIDKAFARLFVPRKTKQHGALNYAGSIGSTNVESESESRSRSGFLGSLRVELSHGGKRLPLDRSAMRKNCLLRELAGTDRRAAGVSAESKKFRFDSGLGSTGV
jgi:hypothetical protein